MTKERLTVVLSLLGVACVGLCALAPQPDPTPVIDHTATARHERHIVPCDECNGTGKVEYDGSVPYLPKGVYQCPMCNGDGTLEVEGPYTPKPKCENPLCLCDKCKCKDCKCGTPTLRAYVVTVCKNPKCKDHGAFARELQRLSSWGDKLRVLANNDTADAVQIKNLNIPCDAFSYVVLTDGLSVHVKPWPKNADEIGNWLLATAKEKHSALEWGVAGDVPPLPEPVASAAPFLSVVVVSDPERCPPCAALERDREEIEDELNTTFRVLAPGEDAAFAVSSIPTTFVLLDGKVIDKQSGYQGKRRYVAWLRDLARSKGAKLK